MTLERLGSLAGVLAVTLFVVGPVLADPAHPDRTISAPAELVARAMAANAETARAGAWCILGGVFLLIVFLGRLQGVLHAAFRPGSWLPNVAVAAGAGLVAVELFSAMLALASAEEAAYGEDAQVAKTVLLLGWNGAALLAPSLAALIIVGTSAAFAGPALPTWLGWVGCVLVALLAGVSALGLAGLAVLPGYLWLAVVSVTLAVRRTGWFPSQTTPETHESDVA